MLCHLARFRQAIITRLGSQALHAAIATILLGGSIALGDDKPSESAVPQLSDKVKAIVDQLRPDVKTLALYVTYVPKVREEKPNLELYAPPINFHSGDDKFHTTEEQCQKIFDWLVADGYFERASEVLAEKSRKRTPGPFYELTISVGAQAPMYHASIGWGKEAIGRLKTLQALLDGPPKAIERMIVAVSSDAKAAAEETLHPWSNGQDYVPSGKLGFPLGTFLTVEGQAAKAGIK